MYFLFNSQLNFDEEKIYLRPIRNIHTRDTFILDDNAMFSCH